MRDGVRVLTLSHIVFIAMLSLSGSISGFLSDVIYYLAFALPLLIGLYGARRLKTAREEKKGLAEAYVNYFNLSGNELLKFLPLVIPVVALVLSVSRLTAQLMGVFGIESQAVENVGFLRMLIVHALLPSVTEELVFRLLPLMLLLPYSPRYCVIISSLFFSLCHCDVFKLPYAFIAGIALMLVDIMAKSILPSVILHFVNNAVSVALIVLPEQYQGLCILTLAALSVASLIFVLVRKKEYKEALLSSLERGEGFDGGKEVLLIVFITLTVSLTNLFMR